MPWVPLLHRDDTDYSANPMQRSAGSGEGIDFPTGGRIGFQCGDQMRFKARIDLNFAYG